ncbi:MAG TPA: hypothetical protein VGM76_10300 [Lacipirellulaceae bacterium]|jgi:hypothetical protein
MASYIQPSRYQVSQQELRRIIADRNNMRERSSALRNCDEAPSRLAPTSSAGRHLVFYHIPRTGGSSIWHALAASAACAEFPIVDLYHLAQKDYGSYEFTYNVLTERQKSLSNVTSLIHLHTPHNISYFLNEIDIVYATIVRDPIDRFISDVCHLHRAWPNIAEVLKRNLIRDAHWQPVFADAMLRRDIPIEAILDMAAQEPFFRYYYYHHFYGLLCQRLLPSLAFPVPESAAAIREVASLTQERFGYIGRYPQVGDSYHDIADLFKLPHDRGAEFTNHINRLDSHMLMPDRRERFGEAFRKSYDLLSHLGITFEQRN